MTIPQPNQFPQYFAPYIQLADFDSLNELEKKIIPNILDFWATIPPHKYNFRYKEDKWSIIDIVRHLLDCSRMFNYRLFHILKEMITDLPSFDEKQFSVIAAKSQLDYSNLLNEMSYLFKADLCLYKTLTEKDLTKIGTINNQPCSINSLIYINIGHFIHHQNFCQDKYL